MGGIRKYPAFAPRKTLGAAGAVEFHNECFSIKMALLLQLYVIRLLATSWALTTDAVKLQ